MSIASNMTNSSESESSCTATSSTTGSSEQSHEFTDELWNENASVPVSIDGCVHDLISHMAILTPSSPAVCAWDGIFNYAELDELSIRLASLLLEKGLNRNSIVPILFEKSKWTPIAMLAVIKAGCPSVTLDHNHPDPRLSSILQQICPAVLITSVSQHNRASLLFDVPIICLTENLLDKPTVAAALPPVSSDDLVYISFTSGTTGLPKGACISHRNVRSAVHYQGRALGFQQQSRVLDFAPYSFDVAWSNFLHTLCAGGCICIPSEDHMLDDLSSAISAFRATLLNVTPTILRTINPIPSTLRTVLLSGEMPYQDNVTRWAGKLRLLNTYGPTECTFKSCFSLLTTSQSGRPDIGRPVGFCSWIVDPVDPSSLVPPGSVGELYLEGPLVGQGYFSAPGLTSNAFLTDPPWLLAETARHPGRTGRLYKTGDLVKRKSDGNLLFIGRKDDAQLKIRGQRIEIGDVEHHVRACLPAQFSVIVDVVLPKSSDTSILALFVETCKYNARDIQAELEGLVSRLKDRIPAFMIPSIFIPVEYLPVGGTGKVNRRSLRQFANELTWPVLVKMQDEILLPPEHHQPCNEIERNLQSIWADVLGLDSSSISTTDNFLRKGGDSVAAMQVVAAARAANVSLTVADIFKAATLAELASTATIESRAALTERTAPFSLLRDNSNVDRIRENISKLCGVSPDKIEDVYPCTPLQKGMIAMTAHNEGQCVSKITYQLSTDVDLRQFEQAWADTTQIVTLLRTRVVELDGEGLVQVVFSQFEQWKLTPQMSLWCDQSEKMALGTSLCRAKLLHDEPFRFVLEMHHAIFDGWSRMLILNTLEEVYRTGTTIRPFAPYVAFVKYVTAANNHNTQSYWRRHLKDPEAIVFPSPDYVPATKSDLEHDISELHWPQTGITSSNIVHSALAILLASYTNTNDVRFGTTVSGRHANIADIENMAGPTIATIPFRYRFRWTDTLNELQHRLQAQVLETICHEQYGLSNIQHAGPGLVDASQFEVLLVVQPGSQTTDRSKQGFLTRVMAGVSENAQAGQGEAMGKYNSYAIMIICQLAATGAVLTINYDSGAIKRKEVSRLASQFEHLLRQICSADCGSVTVQDIISPSEQDIRDIRIWNDRFPEPVLPTYWTRKLQNSLYPSWSSSNPAEQTYSTSDRLTMKLTIPAPIQHHNFSPATLFHAACALVLSRHFSQTQVVFGRLVTGRSTLPAHLQNVIGPCMAELPILTSIEAEETLLDIATRLHTQFIEDSRHEAADMDEIIRHCTSWERATAADFGWRTAYQQENNGSFEGLEIDGEMCRIQHFEHDLLPRSRPEVYATPRRGVLELEFEGNRRLIDESVVGEVLHGIADLLRGC